jgi:hypothetical protein
MKTVLVYHKTTRPLTKVLLSCCLAVSLSAPCAHAQAPRPPADKLTLMRDVAITSPTDKQPLLWDSTLGKWNNASTIADLILYSTSLAISTADFGTATLSNSGGAVLDWSTALKPLVPFADGSGLASVDVVGRKLYKADGTSVAVDWSGTNLKLPQLTTNGYVKTINGDGTLTTDSGTLGGNYITGPLSSIDGRVATWNGINGDALNNSVLSVSSTTATMFPSGPGISRFLAMNDSASSTTRSSFEMLVDDPPNLARLALFSNLFTPTGIISGGDTELRSSTSGGNLILTTLGSIKFSNDYGTTESLRITKLGLAGKTSVITTVDQTATTETAHVTYTVPANSVAAGTTFRISAWGNMDIGGTAVGYTPRIRWGGTGGVALIATPLVTGSAATGTNKSWKSEAYVTIRSTGASGTATCALGVEHHMGTLFTYGSDEADSGATPVTIDTTASKDLALTWTLSVTTGTPHVRTIGGVIEVVKP